MKKIALIFCLLLFSLSHSSYPFIGETLDFEISWKATLSPRISAGNARLQVKQSEDGYLDISSRAWNHSFFKTLTVDDTVKAKTTVDSLFPKIFDQRIKEGGYTRNALTLYNFETKVASIKDTAYKDSKLLHAIDTLITLNGNERCILSAFYLARTLALNPGDTAYFNAIGGIKTYKLKVIAHRRETINTGLGKKNCIVVEPIIQGDGLFKAKGRLLIWLTDDEEKLPVLMKSEISIGAVQAALVKVSRESAKK